MADQWFGQIRKYDERFGFRTASRALSLSCTLLERSSVHFAKGDYRLEAFGLFSFTASRTAKTISLPTQECDFIFARLVGNKGAGADGCSPLNNCTLDDLNRLVSC
jgi:hypothetical protein